MHCAVSAVYLKEKKIPKREKIQANRQGLTTLHFYKVLKNILALNPLHPNISMHILHTFLCTFTKVLTRRICLTIKSFFSW